MSIVAAVVLGLLFLPALEPVAFAKGPRWVRPFKGRASWYGPRFAGRRTASGERFDPRKLTAAHKTLPLGTRVRVTNLHNGRSVLVRINDRGPYVGGRVIDLSQAAARQLGMLRRGVASVIVQPL